MPKKLHYIFDSRAPRSPAKPLQDLIVLKKNAAHCRRWVKSCRWVIELCYDGQRYNDPRWGNDRCCSLGLVGFFSLDQTMEAFVLLEKVLSVIPETVDPAKINGLFNEVSADRYTRRDEKVWLPVLIALADLVEILQSSPEERKQPDKNLL